jgi:polyhydroxyalkanoate synthesis regulator phasin
MWVLPKGNAVTQEQIEALMERIAKLEQKLAELEPKRGRPRKEDTDNG